MISRSARRPLTVGLPKNFNMVTLLNARAKNELYDRVFVCLNLLTETHMIDVLKNAYVDNTELNRGVLEEVVVDR